MKVLLSLIGDNVIKEVAHRAVFQRAGRNLMQGGDT